MQRKNIKSVLEKISSGVFTAEDEVMGKYWIHQLNQKKQSGYSDEDLERISDEMWGVLITEQPHSSIKAINIWFRVAAIAAAILLIVSGVYFFSYRNQISTTKIDLARNDIAPGSIGATLTLAGGKKIRLSDATNGEIAKEAGISVTKTADGQVIYNITENSKHSKETNTLTTARGETYILTLPDKTKVWLNAASSLTYTPDLKDDHGRRKVKLDGEAYFEVFKDKVHPFIVQTATQDVEVLGTHFNVNSYTDESAIATTLLEGSVKVTSGSRNKILKPGQQSWVSGNGIQVKEVDVNEVIAWKDGYFMFQNLPIEAVMRQLERWYNVRIAFDGNKPDIKFTGSISRTKNISVVLNALEETGNIQFEIKAKNITVSKK